MRISDWSSDVCSSDLRGAHIQASARHRAAECRHCRRADEARPGCWCERRDQAGLSQLKWLPPGDRKSVVEGTSVSVRVDLGGRRIIQKQPDLDNPLSSALTSVSSSTPPTTTTQ